MVFSERKALKDVKNKNIRDGGSTAQLTAYTTYTVYTVNTIQTALHWLNISKYTMEKANGLLSEMLDGWMGDGLGDTP